MLQRGDRKFQLARGRQQACIVARDMHLLTLPAQEIHRREMNRVQRSHWLRERLERAREYRTRELKKSKKL